MLEIDLQSFIRSVWVWGACRLSRTDLCYMPASGVVSHLSIRDSLSMLSRMPLVALPRAYRFRSLISGTTLWFTPLPSLPESLFPMHLSPEGAARYSLRGKLVLVLFSERSVSGRSVSVLLPSRGEVSVGSEPAGGRSRCPR